MAREMAERTRYHHAAPLGASFYFETEHRPEGVTLVRFIDARGGAVPVPQGVTCWCEGDEALCVAECFMTYGTELYELRLGAKCVARFEPQPYARVVPVSRVHTVPLTNNPRNVVL